MNLQANVWHISLDESFVDNQKCKSPNCNYQIQNDKDKLNKIDPK